MKLTNWLDETSKDLRIDWYIEPELAWEEWTTQPNGSRLWIRRKIAAAREQHLKVALRELFAGSTMTHLLLVDDAGSGKTVTSLRIEYLLNESSTRTEIFGDSLPRLVIYWSGRLPTGKHYEFKSVLVKTLTSQPSWRERVAALSPREQLSRATQFVDYALREQRLIVIVDAFDELTRFQREKVAAWFQDTSHEVRWIITSRDDAVKECVESDRLFGPKNFRRLRLEPLDSNLQDQYIERALGKKPEEWRTWLQGSREEWNELLGLPNTLREIVRFVTDLGQQPPAWSSPSDLFCQFSAQMIFRELKKRKNNQAWTKLKENLQNGDLSREEGVEFIEMVLGAVALEMATREQWTVVTSSQLTDEIKKIIGGVEIRFRAACENRGIAAAKIVRYWEWAYNFASKFQLHKGSTQGILNARWISFRSKRIQEMWGARFITKYASDLDLRDEANAKGCVLGHNGDPAWTNLWECAVRMPIHSDDKPHGIDAQRYLRVMLLLFERPIQSDQRRPTRLMWQADVWIKARSKEAGCPLKDFALQLRPYLQAQFQKYLQSEDQRTSKIARDLINLENFVSLANTEATKNYNDTSSFRRQGLVFNSDIYSDPSLSVTAPVFLKSREQNIQLKPYFLCKFTVSNEQFQLFDNNAIALDGFITDRFMGANQPAIYCSWYDAFWFCQFVKIEDPRLEAVLPTEARWEYGARAGSTREYFIGKDEAEVQETALAGYSHYGQRGLFAILTNDFEPSSEVPYDRFAGSTIPVKGHDKFPNAWGLEMMAGNVFEWCLDWYGDYPEVDESDPVGPRHGVLRVTRGGCYSSTAQFCQTAFRDPQIPETRVTAIGFRLALTLSENPRPTSGDS